MSKIDEKLNNLLNNRKRDNLTPNSDYIESIKELFGYEDTLPLETRRQAFIDSVRPYVEDGTYTKEMCNDFCRYYLEKKPKGRKFKFETYPTFDVKLRLITWAKRSKQYSIVGMLNKNKH